MKFIVVPILMLLMLTQTFSKWIVWVDYEVNKEYIAKVLCENKKRPMLHCNGKCQLAKKLAAEEEDAKKSASNSAAAKMQFSETLFDDCFNNANARLDQNDKNNYHPYYLLVATSKYVPSIFHPPLA